MNTTYETLKFNDPSYPFIIHRACNNNFLPHWHDSLEIHIIYDGFDSINIDSYQYSVKPLDIVCINPLQTHWYSKLHPVQYQTLIVHPDLLKKCGISSPNNLKSYFNDPYVIQSFKEILKECFDQPPFFEAAIKVKIMNLLIYLYRNYQSEETLAPVFHSKTLCVSKILEFIKVHYTEDIKLSEMGKALGFSVNYMCTCFHQETKTTINKYLNYLRCNMAKTILLEGTASVTEAAMRCGFTNMSYFSKTYNTIIGELPSQTLERNSNLSKNNRK